MAAPMKSPPCDYDFMYPDLLSKEGLLFILRQRYISHLHCDLDTLEKEDLVELYNKFILPSPQRTYRSNRRGKQMIRCQKQLDRKRKIFSLAAEEDHSPNKKLQTVGSDRGLANQHGLSSPSGSRLKPPPSCIDPQKKVVKLNSATKTPSPTVLQIKKITATKETDPGAKGDMTANSKNITTSKESENSCKKTIEENGTSSDGDEAVPTKKKKFTPISWP